LQDDLEIFEGGLAEAADVDLDVEDDDVEIVG
jgi:hypothetical protein